MDSNQAENQYEAVNEFEMQNGSDGYNDNNFHQDNDQPTRCISKKTSYMIAGIGVCTAIALILGLSIGLTRDSGDDVIKPTPRPTVPPEFDFLRISCFPEGERDGPITESKCQERGCIYQPSSVEGVPPCFISFSEEEHSHGYRMTGDATQTELGWSVELHARGKSIFGSPIKILRMDVEMRGDNILRFKVT